jgi:DNA ligase (NAD+)
VNFTRVQELYAKAMGNGQYPADGLVIEFTNTSVQDALGATSKAPRWRLAYKESSASASTTVKEIRWQSGRRKLTPVLIVEPVALSGATIQRVTAHNAKAVIEGRYGVGAVVEIARSGEVIPKVVATVSGVTAKLPGTCPACGSGVTPLTSDSPDIQCASDVCVGSTAARLEYMAKTLGADGFGRATCESMTLPPSGRVDEYLPFLTAKGLEADGITKGIAKKLAANMATRRTQGLEPWRVLASLGIHGLNKGMSQRLMEMRSIDALDTLTDAELRTIPMLGGGDIAIAKVKRGLADNAERIKAFARLFTLQTPVAATAEGDLSGRRVAFTGALTISRKEAVAQLERRGASYAKTVSGSVDVVIVGEKASAAKLAKIAKLGIEMVSESWLEV